jgi:hypothetical protein
MFNAVRFLFRYFVSRSKFIFIHVDNFKTWTPFRRLEVTLSDGKLLIFSILHNRRRRHWMNLCVTYLIHVEIHHGLHDNLHSFIRDHLLTIDVWGGFLFRDKIVGDVLMENYLDRMIAVLQDEGAAI